MNAELPDFLSLWDRYTGLSPGDKAELRRVADPDELREFHALYALFPYGRAHAGWLRVAFLLPWCEDCGDAHRNAAPSLSKLLVDKKISEMRVFQVARAKSPTDIIQFRRMMIQLKHPKLDWKKLGWLLYRSEPDDGSWSRDSKRQLVENFYLAKFTTAKGDKK
jgi:CRISPR system Cascade subunit CasB